MDEQQKQTILDPAKVIAGGVASPVAALLTSRFGVAGTMIGLALTAVIATVVTDVLKVYLARAPGTVTKIPGGFTKSPWRRAFARLRMPFSKFSSLPPARRRPILIGSVIAGGIAFFVGLIVVTGLELGVGKSLSCWVWNECPAESSADGSKVSDVSTLPSIFGGGQSVGSSTLQPSGSQQQPVPGVPKSPSQNPNVPGSGEQPAPPTPGQQWSPSGTPSDGSKEQRSGDQQQSPSGNPSGDSVDQQQTPSGNPSEGSRDQQQSPSGDKSQQPGDQGSVPPVRAERTAADEPQ